MVSACPCMPHADLTIVASATKRYDRGLCGETLNPLSRQASETTNENTRAGPSADIVAQDHTSDDTTTSFRAARVSLDAEEGALIISHLRGRIPEIGADDIWDNATHAELRCNLANAGEPGCGGAPACDNVGQCTQKTMKCTRTKWTECRGCFRGAPGCPGGYHCHAGAWPSPTDGHVHQGGGAFCNWACCVRIGTKDFTRNCPKTGCCKSFQCPSGWTRNGLDPDGDANKDKCCTPPPPPPPPPPGSAGDSGSDGGSGSNAVAVAVGVGGGCVFLFLNCIAIYVCIKMQKKGTVLPTPTATPADVTPAVVTAQTTPQQIPCQGQLAGAPDVPAMQFCER